MDIAWGIEVLAKKDFFSGEVLLRLIGHPMEKSLSKAAKTPTRLRTMLPNQKRIFLPGAGIQGWNGSASGQPQQDNQDKNGAAKVEQML